MAKRAQDREFVWLQCSESGDLNYRTNVRVKAQVNGRRSRRPTAPAFSIRQ